MPTGDIYKATLEGDFAGEPVVMGFGFVSNSGAATFEDDAAGLEAELETALGLDSPPSAFMAPLSVRFQIQRIRIQDLSPGISAGIVVGLGELGGNTVDDATSPHDALCITWRDGQKGKQHRGRTYLTGFAEDSSNAGYWIPEIQSWASGNVAGALFAAFGPLGTGNYQLSIIHTMAGGVRLDPPTATPVTGYTVNNTVRALRRRQVGVRISRRPPAP
jgi:hypothetical protein